MNQNYYEESVKNMSLVVIMENMKGEGEKGRSCKLKSFLLILTLWMNITR
jgi:hypothetical protein